MRFSGPLHPVDQVDRVHEGLDRREDDIVPAPAGIEDLPVLVLDRDGDVAHRVRASRDRLDVELLEGELRGGDPEDRVQRCIHGTVSHGREDMLLSVHHRPDAGGRDRVIARHDGDLLQVERLVVQLDAHDALGDLVQIRIGHPLALVRNGLDFLDDCVELGPGRVDVNVGEHLVHRMPPHVLPEREPAPVPDHLRRHDPRLERGRVLDDPVRVDPALVREDVLAHDRLDRRDADAGEAGDEARGLDEAFLCDPGPDPVHRLHDHHGLGKVGVAGPLPEPVHGHLHLRGAGLDCCDRVRDREAEVVVAVDVDRAPDLLVDPGDQRLHPRGGDDPHRVRHVDDRGPGIGGGPEDLDQVVPVRPRRVHGGEHAELRVLPDIADDLRRDREHFLPALVDGVLPLDIRGRDEDVHHIDIAVETGVHVGFCGAGEPADLRVETELSDSGHRLLLGLRGRREPCLDCMDADVGELACDLKFLFKGECNPRGLFSVPERSVKNSHIFMRRAIGEEDDPPQHPCEQSYNHNGRADYINDRCTTLDQRFSRRKAGGLTIRLIANLPNISSAVPRLNSAW